MQRQGTFKTVRTDLVLERNSGTLTNFVEVAPNAANLPRSGLLSLTFGGDAGHERGRTARGSYGHPARPGPPAATGGPMG